MRGVPSPSLGYALLAVQVHSDGIPTNFTAMYHSVLHHPSDASLVSIETPRGISNGGDDVTADSALSEAAARAAVFARVVSLMNGRSGLRPEVLTFLCDLLNHGITPLLAKRGGEGPSLAKAVLGAGSCMFKGKVRWVNLGPRASFIPTRLI